MKKEVKGMAKETMFKKTGWQLLLMLVAVIWAAVMPTISSAEWTLEEVDTEFRSGYEDVGWETSIATDSNDKAHISYYEGSGDTINYATNASGAWVIETLDRGGSFSSIAIDSNDNVHISYQDFGVGLKYATNASGAWVIVTVDTGRVGNYNSIAIDSNDNVHISYYDFPNNALNYATNASGAWVVETVDIGENVGRYTSIAIDSNDKVHISYISYYDPNVDLKYATNASGLWVIVTINSVENVTTRRHATSIAIDSNDNVHIISEKYIRYPGTPRPYIHYYISYATNASGLWSSGKSFGGYVDFEPETQYPSMAIDSKDKVHISYLDRPADALRYVTNSSGVLTRKTLDPGGAMYISIAIDSKDKVHISYLDSNWNLKYATNATGIQTVSAYYAYNVLMTDPTAVMFDVRTVDEHNGYCPPWDQDCGGQIDTDASYAGTPQWAIGGVEKLPITLPYWYAGINRNTGPPEDEAQVRNIIEGALAANIIDFDTPIYLISRTGYRSYHITAWMSTQTFTNPATDETSSFTNLFNIDDDDTANNDQGGMQEWNAAALPIFDGTIMPPQVFSGYPENGSIETSTNDVIFAAGVLEPTTGSFVYPDVTEVLLYVDGNSPVSMTQVDEAVLRAFFSIPDDVLIPGKVYMSTQYLPDGIYVWNVKATNSAGTSWNLHVLNGSVQGSDGPGQRTLTVDVGVLCTDNDGDGYAIEGGVCGTGDCNDSNQDINPGADDSMCDGVDNDCDGVTDNGYVSTPSVCGIGACTSTGQIECINGVLVDTCTPGAPGIEACGLFCSDALDNDCDGLIDENDNSCFVADYYCDNDDDGYFSSSISGSFCLDLPAGCVLTPGDDCADSNPAINPGGDDTNCDGVDNNCDSISDNDYISTSTTCGLGVCAAIGRTECIDGTEIDTCNPGTPAENPEATCDDSRDNDCDGLTDTEDFADCPISYSITATAGSNGSISPSGNVIVHAGSDQTFTITSRRGYQVSDVLVDGISVGRVISYTFTNVSSDHTIHAEFTKRGVRRGMRRGRRGR